jgi:hypothetical protein
MKLLRLAIPFLFILLGTSACSSNSPGPLAAGKSRIDVHCSGFDILSTAVVSVFYAGTNQQVGDNQSLSCIFSGDVYYDVPAPAQYNVYKNNQLIQEVTFSAAGQYAQVSVYDYQIIGGGST